MNLGVLLVDDQPKPDGEHQRNRASQPRMTQAEVPRPGCVIHPGQQECQTNRRGAHQHQCDRDSEQRAFVGARDDRAVAMRAVYQGAI